MTYKKIGDYGIIGDRHTVALISNDGSIDYYCIPRIDSPSIFAAILDDEKGGYFSIQPEEPFRSHQTYFKDTNILSCVFETKKNQIGSVIDFMPLHVDAEMKNESSRIFRIIRSSKGDIVYKLKFYPRPLYATDSFKLEYSTNKVTISFDDTVLTLITDGKPAIILKEENGASIKFLVPEGKQTIWVLGEGMLNESDINLNALEETKEFWLQWMDKARFRYDLGIYTELVKRSMLVLKLLMYQPTGAIVAAATFGLPEQIGGERNWDYRFSWLRDSSFTLKALFSLGYTEEAEHFIRWLQEIYKRDTQESLQIMYAVDGSANLKEKKLTHLKGYMNSKPVRIGNAAYQQKQLDIYGEVMDTMLRLSDYAGRIDEALWPFLRRICDLTVKHWKNKDSGIWEVRSDDLNFVYSKVMCWVALDRGILIARRYGFEADLKTWALEADKIKKEVLTKGYDEKIGSFVQAYESRVLDASNLSIGLMGFLPIHDARIQKTIETTAKNLLEKNFLKRYAVEDGLKGDEGAFLLCNFWLIESLALSGKIESAEHLLKKTIEASNNLGLFSEEYDVDNQQMLGNFPQAFTHIGLINAVFALIKAKKILSTPKKRHISFWQYLRKMIPFPMILNKCFKGQLSSDDSKMISQSLKTKLLIMRGLYFDVEQGNVDYDALRASKEYQQYRDETKKLNGFNLDSLKTDEAKKTFWINLYNALIIDGVIALNIKSSVKETFYFFGRIKYRVGPYIFSANDIEHGILRRNAINIKTGFRPFKKNDLRLKYCVQNVDARVHCALVCAASSCPPINFYDEKIINEQLDTSARSFINRRGAFIKNETLYLSEIFQWYESDFGPLEKVLNFISQHGNQQLKKEIIDKRQRLTIKYLPYDWDLNRSLHSIVVD